MPHRVVRDSQIFPRMNKDMDRHNKRLREAIKKNLSQIIAKEDIITSDKDKKIRVPIRQLREWAFNYDFEKRPHVGHGDFIKRVTCPICKGQGCDVCEGLGTIPQKYLKQIKYLQQATGGGHSHPLQTAFITDEEVKLTTSLQHDLDEDTVEKEIEKRKGKTGKPRSLTNDKIGRKPVGGGGGKPIFGGDEPGEEEYETEISLSELEEIMFEVLELPNLEDKGFKKITKEDYEFDEIRKVGPISALEKKQTIKANILRNAREKGKAYFGDIEQADLRFRRWDVVKEEEACAVIFAIMDVSGSMTETKKYFARSFYHWMKRFLETQYDSVEIRFIAHHTEAKEVSEEEFFHRQESGGTFMSSGWQLVNEIMQQWYPPSMWNIYIFHFSDGENWSNDNEKLLEEIRKSLKYPVNMIGYGEISDEVEDEYIKTLPYWAMPTEVKDMFKKEFEKESKFVVCEIKNTGDIWKALQRFFSPIHGPQIKKLQQGD